MRDNPVPTTLRDSVPVAGDAIPILADLHRRASAEGGRLTLRAWLDQAETWRIVEALREAGGNRSAAARALGIGRRTLYTKMEKLGIHPAWEAGTSSSAPLQAVSRR